MKSSIITLFASVVLALGLVACKSGGAQEGPASAPLPRRTSTTTTGTTRTATTATRTRTPRRPSTLRPRRAPWPSAR